MIYSKLLCILFTILAAIAFAGQWKCYFHYSSSIFTTLSNQDFWNPKTSWMNKWAKRQNGGVIVGKERFWGSSRWFVFITDGFHFLQFWFLLFISAAPAVLIADMLPIHPVLGFIAALVALRFIFSLVFEVMLSKVLVK